MAFEGVREQLKEQWGDLSSKIQEHPAYNNLREKFESQTPLVQRAIIFGSAALVALFLLSFPFGYFSQSSEYLTQFEENRALIQGLLKASSSAKTKSPLPVPIESNVLRGRVTAMLQANRLLPDQIGDMQDIPQPAVQAGFVPSVVVQNGLAFQLKKLNLTQIIQLSTAVQNLGEGVKLMGIDVVQSTGQTHYYDIILKVVHFGLPDIASSEPPPAAAGKARPRPKGRKSEEEPE